MRALNHSLSPSLSSCLAILSQQILAEYLLLYATSSKLVKHAIIVHDYYILLNYYLNLSEFDLIAIYKLYVGCC